MLELVELETGGVGLEEVDEIDVVRLIEEEDDVETTGVVEEVEMTGVVVVGVCDVVCDLVLV